MAMKTVIEFSLDSKSIGNAIKQLEAYRDDFKRKCELLRQKVAERIRWSAQEGFSSAMVTDVIVGDYNPTNDVQVTVKNEGNVSIVIASGEEAVFIEYGAGVYHNGAVGSSPHPWGAQQGYTIGSYGKGKGKYDAWSFYEDGKRVYTAGTPSAMPMYRGAEEAIRTIGELVREVFG